MKKFIVFSLCLWSIGLAGQTAVILSANTLRTGVEKEPVFTNPKENIPKLGVAPAVLIKSSSNALYHEIELSRLWVGKEETELEITKDFWFSIGYEAGARLKGMDDQKLRIRLGGALNLFYGKRDFKPKSTQVFPIDYEKYGTLLSFTPHVEYYFTEKFFLDFGPKVGLLSWGLDGSRIYNPNFSNKQQKQRGFRLDISPGLLMQIGLGLDL